MTGLSRSGVDLSRGLASSSQLLALPLRGIYALWIQTTSNAASIISLMTEQVS
jgi:hypothetical protein